MGDEVWYATIVGVIVLSGLSIFYILYLAKMRRTKTNAAWKQAATELGLDFTPVARIFGKYRMSGIIGPQLSCSVWANTEPNGQSSTTYMNYDVRFSPPVNLVSISNSPHFQSKLLEVNNVLKKVEVSGDSVKATRVRGFIRKSEILVQNVRLLIQLAELIIPNE
jgi:hypothetical protein